MREILFRGKRIDSGEWVEGYYMKHINRTLLPINDSVEEKDVEYVIFYDAFSDWNMPRGIEVAHIDPATLGQYTGLTDKNGKKIFEGDIIEFDYDISAVKMSDGCWGLDDDVTLLYDLQNVEVIGNIHDNPELLEEN